jgi:hypothetical protein
MASAIGEGSHINPLNVIRGLESGRSGQSRDGDGSFSAGMSQSDIVEKSDYGDKDLSVIKLEPSEHSNMRDTDPDQGSKFNLKV